MPSASKMRSEPDGWSARVITARPPAFSTAAAMVSSSVATTTGPSLAASARRSTCTIIGTPAISASGLPGRRVEAMRAGIRIGRIRTSASMPCEAGRVIRVARGEENRLFVRRRRVLRSSPLPSFQQEPIRDGFLRTQQNPRCRARHLSRAAFAQYRGRRDVRAARAGKAGLRDRGPGRTAGGKPGEQAPAEEPLPVRLASADVERGENDAKKCQACHTFGKGEPNRVGPNLWGVVGRPRRRRRASIIRRP